MAYSELPLVQTIVNLDAYDDDLPSDVRWTSISSLVTPSSKFPFIRQIIASNALCMGYIDGIPTLRAVDILSSRVDMSKLSPETQTTIQSLRAQDVTMDALVQLGDLTGAALSIRIVSIPIPVPPSFVFDSEIAVQQAPHFILDGTTYALLLRIKNDALVFIPDMSCPHPTLTPSVMMSSCRNTRLETHVSRFKVLMDLPARLHLVPAVYRSAPASARRNSVVRPSTARDQLKECKGALFVSEHKLQTTEKALQATKKELQATKKELQTSEAHLQAAEEQLQALESVEDQLEELRVQMQELHRHLQDLQDQGLIEEGLIRLDRPQRKRRRLTTDQ